MARAEMLGLISVVFALMCSSGCYWGARSCSVESERDLDELLESGVDLSTCELLIARTDLRDLQQLADVDSVQWLVLDDNPLLDDISGIEALAATRLNAGGNPLRDLRQLPAGIPTITVARAEVVQLSWTPTPADRAFTLILKENALLESLSVPATEEIARIHLEALPRFSALQSAFQALAKLKSLDVTHCPLVTTAEIEALAALVEDKDRVRHCGNADDEPCPEEVAED